jgi:nucleoside-triphosphatase THEP1
MYHEVARSDNSGGGFFRRPAGFRIFTMGVTIVSAAKGEGKTSFLREQLARMADSGRSVGGIAAPVVFHNGCRIGYDLIDLRHGSRWSLARTVTSHRAAPDVGMFKFDEAAVSAGNAAVVAAVEDGLDVIAIDEVGPLEFDGKGWAPALSFALRECETCQDLIVTVRRSLVDELLNRFPSHLWETAQRVSPPWPSTVPS